MARWLRRLALIWALGLLFFLALGALAAAANASTGHASVTNYLDAVPVPYLAAILAANAIPYLSQLLTRYPGWWTGAATVGLALLDAVLAAVAHAGADDWRHVAAVAVVAWVVARLHLRTFVKGTAVEAWLAMHGNQPHAHLSR